MSAARGAGGRARQAQIRTVLDWRVDRVARLIASAQDTASLNARLGGYNNSAELGEVLPDDRFDPAAAVLDGALRHDLITAMALHPYDQRPGRTG